MYAILEYNRRVVAYPFRLLAGIIVLLFSADAFVKISSRIWSALRISPLIIGATVVAIGTSLPELTVSLMAILRNDHGLAIGNIVGSNIVNVFLILALGILMGHIDIGINKTQKNSLFMALATFLYLVLVLTIPSPRLTGFILLVLAFIFSCSEFVLGINGRNKEDKSYLRNKSCHVGKRIFLMVLAVTGGIIIGGVLVVDSIEKISLVSGYSTTVLGLSVTAVATSLPELLTIVFSRKKDQKKIAIGSILGSNIYNLLFIGGLIYLLSNRKAVLEVNLIFLIFATLAVVFLVFAYAGKKVPRKIGLILLFFFFVYICRLKHHPIPKM